MSLTLNFQLSVIKRGPLDIAAYAFRTTVVGNQGVLFWLDGDDLQRIGAEGYDVEWDMGDYHDLTVFPLLEAIWPADYPRALRSIRGLTMGRYRGPICGHVFRGPAGEYPVTCTIRNRSGVVQTILAATVTKLDPDLVYAGTDTICYSTSGDFTGAPAGASLVTVADGVVTRTSGSANSNKRILLRSGETFSDGISLSTTQGAYIGTFGGDDPAIWTGRFVFLTNGVTQPENITFDNLKCDRAYDPAADNFWWLDDPAPASPETTFLGVTGILTGVTLHRVQVRGCGTGVYMLGEGHVFFDCAITDFFDFGMFDNREKVGLVGCWIAQNPNARNVDMTAGNSGGLPGNRNGWNTTLLGDAALAATQYDYFGPNGEAPNWPRHGPFRMTPRAIHTINRCAFINSQPGWSGHPQPACRHMRDSVGQDVTYGTVMNSFFGGGFNVFNINELGSSPARFMLMDGVTLRGDGNTWTFLHVSMGNAWIRNCLFLLPDGTELDTPQPALALIEASTTAGIFGSDVKIENLTVVLEGDLGGKGVAISATAGGEPINYRNILQVNVATNAGSVNTIPGAVVQTSLDGFTSDLSPLSSNTSVVGKATGIAPVRDMDGNLRGTPGAIGALEP